MDQNELQAALRLIERAALGRTDRAGVTFGAAWERYWSTEGRHLRSAASIAGCLRRVRVAEPGIDALDLMDVDLKWAEAYRDRRSHQVTRFGGRPRPATINRELAAVRRVLAWACEQRPALAPQNPLQHLRLEAERNVRQSKVRGGDELERLLAAGGPIVRALVLLYFDGGLRRMEGMRLRRDQVEVTPFGAMIRLPGAVTKNGRPRRPRITARALAALNELPDLGPYYFTNPETSRPYCPRHLYRMFEKAVEVAGLQGVDDETITLHTLRHSFAYRARVEYRWPETRIMEQGGWRTRSMLDRYGIVDDHELDQAYAEIETFLKRERAELRRAKRKGPQRVPPTVAAPRADEIAPARENKS